jgi:hypothetical protein
MSIRIPQNIIVESKYTSGNEYIIIDTNIIYKGYYYEMNGKIFAGKEFDINAIELQKLLPKNINPFLLQVSSYVYGKLSNIKLNNTLPISTIYQPTQEDYDIGYSIRYFYKKINTTPIIIKETNKENYDLLINDPLYQVVLIKWGTLKINDTNLTQAEQQMPGLKAFLGV